MDDQMPDYKCITCGWEGFVRSRIFTQQTRNN